MKTEQSPATILIVDDALASLQLLSHLLTAQGYKIRAAKTGREAISSVNAELPDLILLDIRLPDINGYEVCNILKNDNNTNAVPVIFISALYDIKEKQHGFFVGGIDYITKPVISEEVLIRVKTHLEIGRLRSQLEHQATELKLKNKQLQVEVAERKLDAEKLTESFTKLEESKTAAINLLEDLKAEIDQRRLTEEALKESNRMLEESQRIAGLGTWTIDLNTGVFNTSVLLDELCGIDRTHGKAVVSLLDIVHPEEKEMMTDYFVNKVMPGKEIFDKEYRIIRQTDNAVRWFYSLGKMTPGENGKPILLQGTTMDITERKQAEKELNLLTLRQQTILATVPDIIMEVDNNKIYTWANKSGLDFFGNDVIGKEASYYFEGMQDTYNLVHPLFMGNENTIYIESWQRRIDGEKRLLAWWCKVLKDERGNVTGALSSANDITERKQAVEALRESEVKFRQTFEFSPVGIVMVGLDKRFIRYNKSFSESLGYRGEELIGKTINDVTLPEDSQIGMAEMMAVLKREMDISNVQKRYLRKDGQIVWGDVVISLVRDKEGHPQYFLAIIQDITDRKRAEEEIKILNTSLEYRIEERTSQLLAANKELEAFSYSVSHDLRAPLRHISGYVELLTNHFHNSLPEKGKHYLDSIAGSANQMGVLIDDLLQFSRTSRQEMRQANLDMNIVLQEVLETIKPDTAGRSIKWNIETLPHVYGDYALLRLVWSNLIDNAVKFTRTKKKAGIEIGYREEKKEYVFFVRDNGAGFDMQYADKLFGVFQRLHSLTEFEGTGIGLANVRRIILRHGGRTWAEAELDKGAVFYFTLPKK